MSETDIYLRRGRLVVLAVLSLAFVAAALFLALHPELQDSWEARVIGAIGILFFGAAFLYCVSRLLHPKPALILRADGIVDQASGVAAGFVPWSEITSVQVSSVRGQRFLCFMLRNPDAVLSQQGAGKRFLMQANQQMVGTPMTVPMDSLTMPGDELLAEVEARIAKAHAGAAR